MSKIRVDDKKPTVVFAENRLVDRMKLQRDVIQLIGLFSEKEIVTMAQALHPAATPKDIVAILEPGYRRAKEFIYPSGMRSRKITVNLENIHHDFKSITEII